MANNYRIKETNLLVDADFTLNCCWKVVKRNKKTVLGSALQNWILLSLVLSLEFNFIIWCIVFDIYFCYL